MSKDTITVQYPALETSQSLAYTKVTKQTVTPANGIKISDAFANKNNSLVICVENTATVNSAVTFNAGGAYPNSELGNLKVPVLAGSVNFFQVEDLSRFEAKDGSISIDFDSTFAGDIFAVAKSAGVN
jgi:hypothetical protein